MDGKVRVPKDNCNYGYENLVSKYREWQMELLERFAARRYQVISTRERAHVSGTICAVDRLLIVQTARPAHDPEIPQ